MAAPQPITPAAISKHAQALLQTPVVVKKLPTGELKSPLVIGTIQDDAGALVCAVVAELACAGSAGAALSKIPAGAVQDLLRRSLLLDEDLLANYHEVVNVLTVLTTAALGRRTVLRAVEQTKGTPDEAVQTLMKEARTKLYLSVSVQGYPAGAMNLYLQD
ncbi:MAG: hypothetical protein JWN04_3059 [Myxococcaceae bacterium]|nr:hypothetical protein [Myxococcaceae bacterium]